MGTFENEHRVLVCDVAIHRVREAVQFTSTPRTRHAG